MQPGDHPGWPRRVFSGSSQWRFAGQNDAFAVRRDVRALPGFARLMIPTFEILPLDCRHAMRFCMAENSVDSIVTDGPYELTSIVKRFGAANAAPAQFGSDGAFSRASRGFMGQTWDGTGVVFDPATWAEAYRVLKPGGHLLAFGGSRTYHRIACAIEDAGFEIRDQIMWLYGSGFPKSHNISKQLVDPIAAAQWEGWGTSLKPGFEPIVVAQKPLRDETELRITLMNLSRIGAQLWLILNAWHAENRSELSQVEPQEVLNTAQWIAGKATNTLVDLSDRTDTLLFESALYSRLNTVWSWRNTLVEHWKLLNTFITETKSGTTIDWKILKSCSSEITLRTIMTDLTSADGHATHATVAVRYFRAELSRLTAILELSALGNVIEQAPLVCQDVAARPIVVARKPLIGTVARNVETWGTGAINIDGCRIECIRPSAKYSQPNIRGGAFNSERNKRQFVEVAENLGRFPANVITDGSDEVLAAFPSAPGQLAAVSYDDTPRSSGRVYGDMKRPTAPSAGARRNDGGGSAARFFYVAKASKADRSHGLDGHKIVNLTWSTWENADQKAALRVDMAPSRPKVIGVYGSHGTEENLSEWNNVLFGKENTEKFRRDMTYTIKTETNWTTALAIWNCFLSCGISANTADALKSMENGENHVGNAESFVWNLTITNEKMAFLLGADLAAFKTPLKISVNDGRSSHPTVKPTDLMRYLCRLVTPPGGTVFDPFMGSGSTGKAAMMEGFSFIGCEITPEYVPIAQARIERAWFDYVASLG